MVKKNSSKRIRNRKQHYDKEALSKAGSYVEKGKRVSIRNRKQK
jgi:hypothetical protein